MITADYTKQVTGKCYIQNLLSEKNTDLYETTPSVISIFFSHYSTVLQWKLLINDDRCPQWTGDHCPQWTVDRCPQWTVDHCPQWTGDCCPQWTVERYIELNIHSKTHKESTKMATVMSSWPLYKDDSFGRSDCIINESSWLGSYGTCSWIYILTKPTYNN